MIRLTVQPEGAVIEVEPSIVALAGFTARDPASVEAHLEELKRIGVETPRGWPVVYPVTPDRLTTDGLIEVLHPETSGEGEFAIILTRGEIYVGAASDHTDRRHERLDIGIAKQLVQRVISREVWRFAEVRDRWDSLVLRSHVSENGRCRLYQEGTVGALLPLEQIVRCVAKRSRKPLEEAVIFSGTLPILGGSVCYGSHFAVELSDPQTGRCLRAEYEVVVNDWVRAP